MQKLEEIQSDSFEEEEEEAPPRKSLRKPIDD